MPFERFRGKQRGFTLIELMIALVILGILAGLAAPSLRSMTLNNRLVTETNDLLADFLYMRSEAIKRATTIRMCKTADPNAAAPACDATAANPWSNGWLIYVDDDSNSTFTAGTDTLLRTGDGFSGNSNKIDTTDDGGGTQLANEILITRLGLLGNGDTGFFSICDSRGASFAKRIDINLSGRARINRTAAPVC